MTSTIIPLNNNLLAKATNEPTLRSILTTAIIGGVISAGLAAGGLIALANGVNNLSQKGFEDLLKTSSDLLLGAGISLVSSVAIYFTHKHLALTWVQIQEKGNASLQGHVISQVLVR
jgi:hypothetical protein